MTTDPTLTAALEAGLDYESRDTLYRFAAILTAAKDAEIAELTEKMCQLTQLKNAQAFQIDIDKELKKQKDAEIAKRGEVIAGLAKACLRLGEAVRRLKERAPHKACIADRTAQIAGEEALAAAAPFMPQTKDEKEK